MDHIVAYTMHKELQMIEETKVFLIVQRTHLCLYTTGFLVHSIKIMFSLYHTTIAVYEHCVRMIIGCDTHPHVNQEGVICCCPWMMVTNKK